MGGVGGARAVRPVGALNVEVCEQCLGEVLTQHACEQCLRKVLKRLNSVWARC